MSVGTDITQPGPLEFLKGCETAGRDGNVKSILPLILNKETYP